jgi:hypothetical protein
MILSVLRGLVLNPLLVAFARGLLEAAAMAGLLFGIEYFSTAELPDQLQMWAPIFTLGLRQLEGVFDKIDPAKQRRRDALREAANEAEMTGGAAGPLNPGDVKDPEVQATADSFNAGDYS